MVKAVLQVDLEAAKEALVAKVVLQADTEAEEEATVVKAAVREDTEEEEVVVADARLEASRELSTRPQAVLASTRCWPFIARRNSAAARTIAPRRAAAAPPAGRTPDCTEPPRHRAPLPRRRM